MIIRIHLLELEHGWADKQTNQIHKDISLIFIVVKGILFKILYEKYFLF